MRVSRDLFLIGGGRLLTALIALATMRAATTLLTPEQYGQLALLIAIQMFCGLLLINPVGQHINLHTHAWWDDGTLLARLKSYRNYVLAISSVGGVVVLLTGNDRSTEQLIWAMVAMVAMVVAGTWNGTLVPMLNMLGYRASSVLWSVVSMLVGLLCSIFLAKWLPLATTWFAGQALGMAVGAFGARHALRRYAKISQQSLAPLSLLNRNVILTYCIPLSLATGLMWLQLSGYRFVIDNFWGLASLGLLAVGMQLAGQVWGLAESLAMQFLYPLFYRRVTEFNNHAEVGQAFSDLLNTLVPIYFVLAGLLVLGAPYLQHLLVAAQFQGALIFVMLGAGVELCRVLGNLLSNAAHVKRSTKSLALPYAAGALTILLFICLAGMQQMAVIWAGVGLLIGSVSMLAVMWVKMYQQIRFVLDGTRWVAGILAMLVMIGLIPWMPNASSLTASIGMLVFLAVMAGGVLMALLWKNPATMRLINVQLQRS